MKYFLSNILILLSLSLFSQANDFKNQIEVGAVQFDGRTIRLYDIFQDLGFSLKYKRTIYHDHVNSLSIGLTGIKEKSRFVKNYYVSSNEAYGLASEIQVSAVGPCISNRFETRFKKIGLFMDLELSSLFQWGDFENTRLIEGGYLEFGFANLNGLEIETDKNLEFNPMVVFFGIQAGIEFYLDDNLHIYLCPGISRSINGFYKQESISDFIPPIEKELMDLLSLNLGTRF